MNPLLHFEIEALPKMTNPSGARSTHWRYKLKEAQKWKALVLSECRKRRRCIEAPYPLKNAKLVLTRFSSVSPDPDGLVSGFKHVIDGLVEAGVLVNDRYVNIGMPEYRWEKVKPKAGKIRVEVYA